MKKRILSNPKWKVDLWSAKLEAYLSTHAFELLALVIYTSAVILQFIWGAHDEFHFRSPDTNLRWYISIARGAGYVLNLTCALVILMASRLLITKVRDTPLQHILPLDKSFPAFHVIIGYTIAGALLIHVPFHFTWIIAYDQWEWGLWSFNQSVATGIALLIVFVVMLITALPNKRKKKFRRFYIVHMIGAFLFFILLIFHGMYRNVPETYKWVTGPLIIYAIDRLVRRLKVSTSHLELSSEHSSLRGSDILELRVPRPFMFRAGQYAEILVPSISKEWHPFTIASAPHEETMCFYIKALGNWTKTLREAFEARQNGDVSEPLMVQIRGPYGAPAQHVKGYERVVLISGGVGSTPFAAISKHLHHLNKVKKQSVQRNSKTYDNGMHRIESRIRHTITSLYDVHIDDSDVSPVDEAEEQRRQYLADMLNLTAENTVACRAGNSGEVGNGCSCPMQATQSPVANETVGEPTAEHGSVSYKGRNAKSVESSRTRSSLSDDPSFVTDLESGLSIQRQKQLTFQKGPRQKLAHLYERRSKLLAFLHTTRVMLALLMNVIVRIILVCVMAIFDLGLLNFAGSRIDAVWLVITDTVLGIMLTSVLALTLFLEISYMGMRYFRRFWRLVDFFVFLPVSILCNISGLRAWAGSDPNSVVLFFHYIVFLPLMLFLLAGRMYRSIGSRNLLDDGKCNCDCKCNKTIPDVDFVWTTPHGGDDQWLRNELYPLENGTELRLHRYVTREEKDEDLEAEEEFISAKAGRPKWDALFSNIAEEAPSRVEIGVFFCGPHTMGEAVRKSIRKVEIMSNLRGAYLEATPDSVLAEDLQLQSPSEAAQLRGHGCNVRFVFREENFG